MTRCPARVCGLLGLAALGALSVSCDEEVVVGTQCPSPFSGMASVETPPDAGKAYFYGTSCAPCSPDDELTLDDDGCPTYVTFSQCGGDVCLFGLRVAAPVKDAGTSDASTRDAGDDDAGAEPVGDQDAGVVDDAGQSAGQEEDGG